MIKIKVNGKYEVYLPEHRAIRPEWKTGWEVKRIDKMVEVLTKDDIVFDIGAEEGDISAILAKRSSKIVLFEPNPKVWSNIKAIWDANNLETPLQFVGFASDKTNLNPKNLNINDETLDGWTVYAYDKMISDHGFRQLSYEADATPQIKIDDFCKENNIYPTFITIDVEGSEFNVLKGAKDVLKQNEIDVFVSVHPEFMFDQYGYYTADLKSYMHSLGYRHELLAFDHEFHFYFYKI